MAWLKRNKKNEDDAAIAVLEQPVERTVLPTGPQLAVLVPDIAGISSFRFQLVNDTDTAEEQIIELRPDVRRGTHAFWALHDEPAVTDDTHVEALVLIRSSEGSDLVYVVSFLDLESALSFTRFEVRRGLHLGNVMVYWAAFATVREVGDRMEVRPRTAPSTKPYWPEMQQPEAAIEEPAIADIAPAIAIAGAVVAEPAPRTNVEREANDAIERYLEQQEREERSGHAPSRAFKPSEATQAGVMDTAMTEPEPEVIESVIEDIAPVLEAPVLEELVSELEELVVEDVAPVLEAPIVEEPVVETQPFPRPPVVEEAQPFAKPPVIEEALVVEPEVIEPELEAGPVIEDPVLPEDPEEPEDALFSEIPEEQAAIEEAVVFRHAVTGDDAPEMDPMVVQALDAGMIDIGTETLTGAVETVAGDEEDAEARAEMRRLTEMERLYAAATVESIEGDEEIETPTILALNGEDPSEEMPPVERYDEFNIAYEVERLLRNRRWKGDRDSDGPFDGFKSPPGRF